MAWAWLRPRPQPRWLFLCLNTCAYCQGNLRTKRRGDSKESGQSIKTKQNSKKLVNSRAVPVIMR